MVRSTAARRWLAALIDGVFPRTCLVCGLPGSVSTEQAAPDGVCAPCLEELPWNTQACTLCAAPITRDREECVACELQPPTWDHALAPLRYAPPVDTLIRRLKFRASTGDGVWLARTLALALLTRETEQDWPQLLVPVPMHPGRRALRGFNHAAFLAQMLSAQMSSAQMSSAQPLSERVPALRVDTRSLQRTRWTPTQASLDAPQRRKNLSGAFRWRGSGAPARVAIVDDVLTTGATAATITHTLREAGAEQVQLWICARAGRRPQEKR